MTLVVDASVALKWYLNDEPHADAARALLNTSETLIAPDLVIAEVCNAAWLCVRANRIRGAQAQEIARSVADIFDTLVSGSDLAERAMTIAVELDHVAYDCFYLALAEAQDAPLVTADRRLLRKLRSTPWAARALNLADYG